MSRNSAGSRTYISGRNGIHIVRLVDIQTHVDLKENNTQHVYEWENKFVSLLVSLEIKAINECYIPVFTPKKNANRANSNASDAIFDITHSLRLCDAS